LLQLNCCRRHGSSRSWGARESFQQFGLRLAREHRAALAREPLPPERRGMFQSEALASLEMQAAIEAAEKGGFDEYLAARLEGQSRFA
jgi:gamma-glutamylcysteine synthetase